MALTVKHGEWILDGSAVKRERRGRTADGAGQDGGRQVAGTSGQHLLEDEIRAYHRQHQRAQSGTAARGLFIGIIVCRLISARSETPW